MTASIRIENERETGVGWAFDVEIDGGSVGPRRVTVALSWVDYEYWTHGLRAPADLVRELVGFLLERGPASELKDRFDAAAVRRRHPEVDGALGGRSSG